MINLQDLVVVTNQKLASYGKSGRVVQLIGDNIRIKLGEAPWTLAVKMENCTKVIADGRPLDVAIRATLMIAASPTAPSVESRVKTTTPPADPEVLRPYMLLYSDSPFLTTEKLREKVYSGYYDSDAVLAVDDKDAIRQFSEDSDDFSTYTNYLLINPEGDMLLVNKEIRLIPVV